LQFFQPVPMGAKGTGWDTRYPRPEPMVSVCGCRLENRYLRASSTGAESLFSSSDNCIVLNNLMVILNEHKAYVHGATQHIMLDKASLTCWSLTRGSGSSRQRPKVREAHVRGL